LPFFAVGQYTISGSIHRFSFEKIYLYAFDGEKLALVDSVTTDANGAFLFETPLQKGMFELVTESQNSIPILYDGNPVQFVISNPSLFSEIDFVNSPHNQDWALYTQVCDGVEYLKELVKPVLREYTRSSDFYDEAKKEYNKLQFTLQELTDSLIARNTFASRFIRADRPLVVDVDLTFDQQRAYFIEHFFDETDFGDTLLIYSNVLSTKLIDFLSLTQSANLNAQQSQLNFITGIDFILQKANENTRTYTFVVDYLLNGFSQLGLGMVVDYLVGLPHLNADCLETNDKLRLETLIEPYQKIKIGSKAPEIETETIAGNTFDLYALKAKTTLIYFWSITCPHCLEMMNDLTKLVREKPEITLVTVMTGFSNTVYKDFIEKEHIPGHHICDNLSWDSPIIKDYHVVGTPTLFVLNDLKTIVQKPYDFEELQLFLNKK
jgi:thiol-disulfide isomerase/thioredoxin